MGTPLIANARVPAGSAGAEPIRRDLTVRIPNVSAVEFSVLPCCDTDVVRRYSGCAPSW